MRALDDFTLQVERGEIFGFLGPNGAGKTTAIHLAMGFMRPTRGKGRMLGEPFGHARTRRRVGFLAENVALYHRRAGRLVRFYGALNGMGGAQLSKRAAEVLEAVNLTDLAGRNVGKFSRGMVQRLGLAQALVNDPELLILDEPTSALDPLARVAVRELLLACGRRERRFFSVRTCFRKWNWCATGWRCCIVAAWCVREGPRICCNRGSRWRLLPGELRGTRLPAASRRMA